MYDLRRTIENFALQLRSKFRAEIELDTAQFKRRAIGLFPRNLPLNLDAHALIRSRAPSGSAPERDRGRRSIVPVSRRPPGYESESICALPCGCGISA